MPRAPQFFLDESGAITADWVVLSGAVVGLGVATMAVVSGGVENLSGGIAAELAGQTPGGSQSGSGDGLEFMHDFTNGSMSGWSGGQVMSPIEALGETLVLGAGESTSLDISIPEGTETATLSFDLIGGDSLDNEAALFTLNGTRILEARGTHWNGAMSFTDAAAPGVSISTEVLSEGTNLGGAAPSGWRDTVTRVSITIDEPDGDLTFGVASGTNQQISDEYYGIDNVAFSAR